MGPCTYTLSFLSVGLGRCLGVRLHKCGICIGTVVGEIRFFAAHGVAADAGYFTEGALY